MKYTFLGRTGLRVSRLCLGTMNFGVDTDEKTAFRIMDEALDSGIQFFDTANIYGWGKNAGLTESLIGKWFAQGGSAAKKSSWRRKCMNRYLIQTTDRTIQEACLFTKSDATWKDL